MSSELYDAISGIDEILNTSKNISTVEFDEIISKIYELKGLSLEESAKLLSIEDDEKLQKLFQAARHVKEEIYGRRMVLFAPLYTSNECSNNCLYCAFRKDNDKLHRKSLTPQELESQVREILEQGHKRLLMLMGEEGGKASLDHFFELMERAYSVKDSHGSSIRRINIEIAPLSSEEFRRLSEFPIGTYVVFQETYHRETYELMHPSGKKADFSWRVEVMDRALQNGLNDVGLGVLYGLYDYKFDTIAMLAHGHHLDRKYGVGPHTLSVPRIEPALGAPVAETIPYPVSDRDFRKIVAVLRCSLPYTGIILSTRETAAMRRELMSIGVSQVSAGSKTDPGGYGGEEDMDHDSSGQFSLNDTRSTGEVIRAIIEDGYIPSFCTGCYRKGRVGADFMDLAKPGLIKLHCEPNGLMTLKEYLLDYADEETRTLGEKLIASTVSGMENVKRKQELMENLKKIESGERDIYF